jgi:hypothetical protein
MGILYGAPPKLLGPLCMKTTYKMSSYMPINTVVDKSHLHADVATEQDHEMNPRTRSSISNTRRHHNPTESGEDSMFLHAELAFHSTKRT